MTDQDATTVAEHALGDVNSDLEDFAQQIADQVESFLLALRAISRGEADGSIAISLLLLEVSQVLLAGGRLGVHSDFTPADEYEPDDLKIAQLYTRVERADPPIREVVVATNPTTTGEATALHVAAALHDRAPDVAVTRLASGLPVGGDLEYADEVTLGRALAGRRVL